MKIYATRYQANKVRRSDEIVVKVEGGYIIMTYEKYYIWKSQK